MRKFKIIARINIEAEDYEYLYREFKIKYPDFEIQSVQEIKEIEYDRKT